VFKLAATFAANGGEKKPYRQKILSRLFRAWPQMAAENSRPRRKPARLAVLSELAERASLERITLLLVANFNSIDFNLPWFMFVACFSSVIFTGRNWSQLVAIGRNWSQI
jgi:hypothetical protein